MDFSRAGPTACHPLCRRSYKWGDFLAKLGRGYHSAAPTTHLSGKCAAPNICKIDAAPLPSPQNHLHPFPPSINFCSFPFPFDLGVSVSQRITPFFASFL